MKNDIIIMRIGVVFLDIIISFFRDVLSGPVYIVVLVVGIIGICACIGYLAEETMKRKELADKQNKMYASVSDVATTQNIQPVVQEMPTVMNSELGDVVSNEDIAKLTGATVVTPASTNINVAAENTTAEKPANKQ